MDNKEILLQKYPELENIIQTLYYSDPVLSESILPLLDLIQYNVWEEARQQLIERFMKRVDDDGFIDQHVVAIGGSKALNPYQKEL